MTTRSSKPAVEAAATRLRAIALAQADGTLIGSEDSLLQILGFSRSTVRQVARLLEQEGVLRVKRGIGGGYYAARPNAKTIERAVSTYLETVEFDAEDITLIASALWVEVIRKAAGASRQVAIEMAEGFRKRVHGMKATASFAEVRAIERDSQQAMLTLARSPYVALIFDINVVFASRVFPSHEIPEDSTQHRTFVKQWREAKLLELAAVADGNAELGMMAARYVRSIWHRRIWSVEASHGPLE